jgi:hypothetical protein
MYVLKKSFATMTQLSILFEIVLAKLACDLCKYYTIKIKNLHN